MKRILILTMVSLLMFNTVGFAAVGGSKMKMSAPKISNTQRRTLILAVIIRLQLRLIAIRKSTRG